MNASRRIPAIFLALAVPGLLTGCGLTQRVTASINPDSLGTTDRCAYIMKVAMPSAEIEVDKRSMANVDLNTVVAKVEGTRTDLPDKSPVPPAVAAECEFKGGILSTFHWTKGGALR